MHQEIPPKFVLSPEFLKAQGWSSTFLERFWNKVDKNGPIPEHVPHLGNCWVWTGCKLNNYGAIATCGGKGQKRLVYAHIASWIIHNGPIHDELLTLHKCDEPSCVRFSHLWRGTDQDNSDDAKFKGRLCMPKGESNAMHKLTTDDIIKIRSIYKAGGISQKALGKLFGVCEANIFCIVNRIRWKHV